MHINVSLSESHSLPPQVHTVVAKCSNSPTQVHGCCSGADAQVRLPLVHHLCAAAAGMRGSNRKDAWLGSLAVDVDGSLVLEAAAFVGVTVVASAGWCRRRPVMSIGRGTGEQSRRRFGRASMEKSHSNAHTPCLHVCPHVYANDGPARTNRGPLTPLPLPLPLVFVFTVRTCLCASTLSVGSTLHKTYGGAGGGGGVPP